MAEYIEREDVEKAVLRYANGDVSERELYLLTDLLGDITGIPAAYVQPVKRGKWKQVSIQVDEYNNHLYECTACRATDRHNINVNVPYCWHCGAKMEE